MQVAAFTTGAQQVPVIAQALEGTFETRDPVDGAWKPVTEPANLQAGQEIRTGGIGQAALWLGEWGWVLLHPETQLAVEPLTVGTRSGLTCNLRQGDLDLEFFDVPDSIAFAVQYLDATLSPQSSRGAATFTTGDRAAEIRIMDGDFDVKQGELAEIQVFGAVENSGEGGIGLRQAANSTLTLRVNQEDRTIRVQSEKPLPAIQTRLGSRDNALRITNNADPFVLNSQGNTAIMDQAKQATFLLPSDQDILLTTEGRTDFHLSFRKAAFFAVAEQGPLLVNGQPLAPGDCSYLVIPDPPRTEFFRQRREKPIVPQAPAVPLPEAPEIPVGSPVLP